VVLPNPAKFGSPVEMTRIIDDPFIVSFVFLFAQWVAAYIGDIFRRTVGPVKKVEQEDFNTALIIGFSFSMNRRNYEAAEANAIGTEYIRADLVPVDGGGKVRELLGRYSSQRISFYLGGEHGQISQADSDNEKLQAELGHRSCMLQRRSQHP
jgi:hypothetical protein